MKTDTTPLFSRSKNRIPYPYPAEHGDIHKLDSYLTNMSDVDKTLFKAWLTYTLAHPKSAATKYVILVLNGPQGSCKSFTSNIISSLLSPNRVGTQVMPKNQKDLAVVAKDSHTLIFDNLRNLTQQQSDDLCIMSSGGHISCRQLYSNGEAYVMPLHTSLVLNGIHDFISQPDLAQRCLSLKLNIMDESNRLPETQLYSDLERDLPIIFRGLLDLISQILSHLPDVEITHPERMIDFVHWLAALEIINRVPPGSYQSACSDNLKNGQLDSLLDDPLTEILIDFSNGLKTEWQDEPKQLLTELNDIAPRTIQRASEWPKTATSLSRRLRSLQAALRANGVYIEFGRGERRWIKIETDITESRF